MRVQAEQGEWVIEAGEAILLRKGGRRHIFTPQGADWMSVGLTATLFGRVDAFTFLKPPAPLRPPDAGRTALETALENLLGSWDDPPWRPQPGIPATAAAEQLRTLPSSPPDFATALLQEGYGRVLFGHCWRLLAESNPNQIGAAVALPDWLITVLGHINETPALALSEIAEAAGMTEVQLRRGFHRYLGTSPHAYLTRARLDAARRLLETTSDSVAVVAGQVGFESLSYFTRLFKRTFGVPPAAYRRHSL